LENNDNGPNLNLEVGRVAAGMNLGRPFKAGIQRDERGASRQRRLNSAVDDATETIILASFRAVKGPAYFIRRYAAYDSETRWKALKSSNNQIRNLDLKQ
jgi:hypothetical protein